MAPLLKAADRICGIGQRKAAVEHRLDLPRADMRPYTLFQSSGDCGLERLGAGPQQAAADAQLLPHHLAQIDLGNGRRLTIRRDGPEDGVIARANLNGRALPDFRVDHAALLRGGILAITTVAQSTGTARRNVPQLQDTAAKTLTDGARRRR